MILPQRETEVPGGSATSHPSLEQGVRHRAHNNARSPDRTHKHRKSGASPGLAYLFYTPYAA